ncbi:hypothetical protein SCLCIDRAFT_206652 [Scleroderma citrinum Foug A]|uniref:Uncharacterized protein n=1 Tax=Scleroderma citrinum Foug A TaxID=1036808 RepID=A0A0C2ZWE0_9AGAM|nr:hypothetical protein SCLCIDRAFT_206652 [Scleroderma citrinum Foug A]
MHTGELVESRTCTIPSGQCITTFTFVQHEDRRCLMYAIQRISRVPSGIFFDHRRSFLTKLMGQLNFPRRIASSSAPCRRV